mgnify:CR=1 FL=1
MGEAAALQTGAPLRALVLGGYGNFGARIVRALAGDAAIQLVVAGRDVQRARALIEGLSLEVATPAEAREILGLKGRNNVDF